MWDRRVLFQVQEAMGTRKKKESNTQGLLTFILQDKLRDFLLLLVCGSPGFFHTRGRQRACTLGFLLLLMITAVISEVGITG